MKKLDIRQELISKIISLDIKCSICGFTFSSNYLNTLHTSTIKAIYKRPEIKIHEHNKNCIKRFNYQSKIKFCTKCNAEMSNRKSSNICDKCLHIEKLTKTCKHCNTTVILTSAKEHFEYCDKCITNDIIFKTKFEEFAFAERGIRTHIYDEIETLSTVFFKKFFNKKNKQTTKENTTDFYKLKAEKYNDICNIINQFINHLTNAYIKYNWNDSTISKIITCIINTNNSEMPGWQIDSNTYNIESINFEKVLYAWKEFLADDFNNVISVLQEFKFKSCEGTGEFFWIIINKNIQCNFLGIADALYNDNSIGEIKSAKSKTTAGRLLFTRDAWFGVNDFNKFKIYLKNDLHDWQSKNGINVLNSLINKIDTITPEYFSWNNPTGFYQQCINELKTVNKQLVNCFIKHIFNLTINHNQEFKPRFLDLDLSEKENFKLFHFVNYCLYYILIDAKSENLNKLIFISENNALVLNINILLNYDKKQVLTLINDWEVSYPKAGFTKTDKTSHDRNKDRAPGIYFKKENNIL